MKKLLKKANKIMHRIYLLTTLCAIVSVTFFIHFITVLYSAPLPNDADVFMLISEMLIICICATFLAALKSKYTSIMNSVRSIQKAKSNAFRNKFVEDEYSHICEAEEKRIFCYYADLFLH